MSKEITNPLEYILDCLERDAIECPAGSLVSKFVILNAKDQLKRLTKQEYMHIGWARQNDRGDIYDLRLYKPIGDDLTELFIRKKTYEQ